jgi:Arc/MetJ-type ribon-helix-helix transcriptional regulator
MNEKTANINIEIPQSLHDRLFAASRIREDGRRVSMSEHVRRAIVDYLERLRK